MGSPVPLSKIVTDPPMSDCHGQKTYPASVSGYLYGLGTRAMSYDSLNTWAMDDVWVYRARTNGHPSTIPQVVNLEISSVHTKTIQEKGMREKDVLQYLQLEKDATKR